MPDQGKTGFFEESPGVKSMTRLSIGWLLGLASFLVSALVFYIVWATVKNTVQAGVITAIAVPLGALIWHGVVAIKNRNAPDAHET